jgi:hypothetical protein
MNRDELFREWKQRKREIDAIKEWRESIETKLPSVLQSLEESYHWEGQQPMDGETGRKTIDIKGTPRTKNGSKIYIEVEAARPTCVRNVVKVWMDMSKNETENPVLLIHVFSPFFKKRPRGKAESLFIGQQAQKATNGKLKYKYIQLDELVSEYNLATMIASEVKS